MIKPIPYDWVWLLVLSSELLLMVLLTLAWLRVMQWHKALLDNKTTILAALSEVNDLTAKLTNQLEQTSQPLLTFSVIEKALIKWAAKHTWWLKPILSYVL